MVGAFVWQSIPHLDLLPTALVLVHQLTGLHDGFPHIRDDFCHLCNTKPADSDTRLCGNDSSTERKICFILISHKRPSVA